MTTSAGAGRVRRAGTRDLDRVAALWTEITHHHEGMDPIFRMRRDADAELARLLHALPVFHVHGLYVALNTSFLGALDEPGVWREKCHGCGDCVLAFTAGICPVARCAKRLFNGPCGGSRDGKCEISRDVECAWALIVSRLSDLNRLDLYEKILPPKDWSAERGSGPRVLRRSEDC